MWIWDQQDSCSKHQLSVSFKGKKIDVKIWKNNNKKNLFFSVFIRDVPISLLATAYALLSLQNLTLFILKLCTQVTVCLHAVT